MSIGTVTAHNVDMPAMLAAFHRAHPAVEITLSTADSESLVDGVRTGRLDLAIASVGSGEVPDGLAVEVTTDEAIDAAVHLADPWRRRRSVPLAALAERTLIALPVGTGIRRRLEEAFTAAGLTPRIAFEASTRRSWPTSPRADSGSPSSRSRWPATGPTCTRCRSLRSCADDSCWRGERAGR